MGVTMTMPEGHAILDSGAALDCAGEVAASRTAQAYTASQRVWCWRAKGRPSLLSSSDRFSFSKHFGILCVVVFFASRVSEVADSLFGPDLSRLLTTSEATTWRCYVKDVALEKDACWTGERCGVTWVTVTVPR